MCRHVRQPAAPDATPINKASLEFHRLATAFCRPMRIVDVCAFYTPAGGGVRTYVEAKLKAAPRLRPRDDRDRSRASAHEVDRARPGRDPRDRSLRRRLPVDRRYRYFDDEARASRGARRVAARPCRSIVALVERDHGRALARRGQPIAGDACRSARGLCLSLARRVRVDRARSTAGSAGSGAICAGSAGCSTRSCAPTTQLTAAAPRRRHRQCRDDPDGRRGGPVLAGAAVARAARCRRWRRSGSMQRCDPAHRRRPLFGREALGHGDARGRARRPRRRSACCSSAMGRSGASSSCLPTGLAASPCSPRIDDRDELAACSPAPTRWFTAARPRPSAWSPPRRARAAFR